MRHVLAAVLLGGVMAVVALGRGDPEPGADRAAAGRMANLAPQPAIPAPLPLDWRPHVEPLPRITPTKLPAIEQPIVGGVGFVVDREALGWLPRSFLLREGDAVLEVDGEPVTSTRQVADAVRGASEGSAVQLHVRLLRGGTTTYWVGN